MHRFQSSMENDGLNFEKFIRYLDLLEIILPKEVIEIVKVIKIVLHCVWFLLSKFSKIYTKSAL